MMGKKIFTLIIILMSIALIGIISVQVFWIKNTIQISDNQFSSNIKFALAKISEDIRQNEFNEFYKKVSENYKEGQLIKGADVRKLIFQKIDTINNERFTFSQSIIEQNYKVPSEFFESDSLNFSEVFSKEEIVIVEDKSLEKGFRESALPEERITKMGRFPEAEKVHLVKSFDALKNRLPIHQRISNKEIEFRLGTELKVRGIDTDFKYGIYSSGLATQVKSGYFRKDETKNFMVPMFADSEGNSNYELYVTFPNKKYFILSSIYGVLILSAIFILIIIFTFVTALYQLLRQKQISEIKTDFINNMTHEFKTPIATINLALDAIKNPKIINDEDKVKRYVKMIRDENKRMHNQVENVLRISKLEKNQLDLNKNQIDIHDVIEDAISHVELIIRDRNGIIDDDLKASNSVIYADSFHFTNLVVNMFDNAIKYSEDAPVIKIWTNNEDNNLIIKIKDNGIGMNKNVQKNIFKKFYREERGNIHTVKGHGLGLSYVKKILEIHQGEIYVKSEKGKGSTFTIKLPYN